MPVFRYFTAGESHGKGGVAIIEGIPAGVPISEDYIEKHMRRRQQGYGRGPRQQLEVDRAEILSGVRHGFTMGGPIAMWVENRDFANWTEAMSVTPVDDDAKVRRVTRLRPGHADFPGVFKYSVSDVRPILERSSARETAARVAAGAVARRFLEEFGIAIHSHVLTIGTIKARMPDTIDWDAVEQSPVRTSDPEAAKAMMAHIDYCRDIGNTAGGVFEVIAYGAPIGLGSFIQWDQKLDGLIAQGMMSIQAVKGVEIGSGFANTELPGSMVHDIIQPWDGDARPFHHITNRAGGIEGGMSSGEPIVARMALKPISTLSKPLPSVDLETGEIVQAHYERSDICQVPPACVIGEAVMATILAKCFIEKFGGDHLKETRRNYEGYLKALREVGPKQALTPSARPGITPEGERW
ncbi:MAG: chorismate synthase [Chloroflexi bacterium]|nr:chorismate synthase [Chloroflexota bacterium]